MNFGKLFLRLRSSMSRVLAAAMLATLLMSCFGHAVSADSPGEIGFSSAGLSTAENGGAYRVEVKRTGGTSGIVKVDFKITDGTAIFRKDYQSSGGGTLTFNDGVDIKYIQIVPIDNDFLDGDRTLTVTLSNPTNGASLGAFATTSVTIADDETTEDGVIQFAEAEGIIYLKSTVSVGEFPVTRTSDASKPSIAIIDYVVDNVTQWKTSVMFAAGEKEAKLFLHFDPNNNPKEHFRLVLSSIQGEEAIGADKELDVHVIPREVASGGEFVLLPKMDGVFESAGQFEFAVGRNSVTENVYGGVSVDYEIIPGTAEADLDYTPISGTLHFGENEREQSLSVPIIDDNDHEGDETFTVRLSNPQGGAVLGESSLLPATIVDDDDDMPLAGTLGFERAAYSVEEPTYSPGISLYVKEVPVDVSILRTGGSDVPVTVDVYTSDGTAEDDHEYGSVTESVYFPAGVSSQTVKIPVYTTDGDRTFHVHLANPTGGAKLGRADAEVTIVDKGFDGPKVYFDTSATRALEFVPDPDSEWNWIWVLFDDAPATFSVDYEVIDGTAKNGEDFILNSGTLHVDGELKSVIIPVILEDGVKEPDETFTIKLSNPTNGFHLGDRDAVTVTIEDNGPDANPGDFVIDPVRLQQLGLTYNTGAEENSEQLTAYVYRLNDYGWDKSVSVDYAATAAGTGTGYAEAGADFQSVQGTLDFAPGEKVKQVAIPLIDDNEDERTEAFQLTLGNPGGGARIAGDKSMTLQILDTDDILPAGKFQLPPARTIDETEGIMNVTVMRVDGSEGAATVDYATVDGTAKAGSDYTAAGGTLSFGPGETMKTIEIPIVNDTAAENAENFKIVLSHPTGGATIVEGASESVVTIAANDRNGSFSFATSTYLALEESGPFQMTIQRKYGTDDTVSVNYSIVPVSAEPGEDYTDISGTLTFQPGVDKRQITLDIIDDNMPEGAESFIVKLSDPTGGARLGSPSERTVTLYDKDNVVNPPGTLQMQPSLTVDESGGKADVVVNRTHGSGGTVTVRYATADGTAAAGSDYASASGTLTFAPGEWSKTITVPIVDDAEEEGGETFTVTLSNPTGGATIQEGAAKTNVTIASNDHYGTLHFETPTYYALEESGPIEMKVLRNGVQGTVTVQYTITPVSATPGADYKDVSGTLTFAPNQDRRYFDIDILDDDIPEGAESFIVKLSDPTGGAHIGAPSERVITIYDKDRLG